MLQEFKEATLWKKHIHIDFDLYLFRATKIGICRFLSHLEWIHALERTLRRADFPLWFSKGYHPIPGISTLRPLPTGVASSAQYFLLRLKRFDSGYNVPLFIDTFNRNAPDGLRLLWGVKTFDTFHLEKYARYWDFGLYLSGKPEEKALALPAPYRITTKPDGFMIEYIAEKDAWLDYRTVLENLFGDRSPNRFYSPFLREVYFSMEQKVTIQALFDDLEDEICPRES